MKWNAISRLVSNHDNMGAQFSVIVSQPFFLDSIGNIISHRTAISTGSNVKYLSTEEMTALRIWCDDQVIFANVAGLIDEVGGA